MPSSALAAEKSFTSMFPGYADGAKDPKAAEAVLAGMGTLIGQKQTVNGVTLTLEGALWNKDKMLLSFTIDGASTTTRMLPAFQMRSMTAFTTIWNFGRRTPASS